MYHTGKQKVYLSNLKYQFSIKPVNRYVALSYWPIIPKYRASVKGSLGVIYSQKSPLNFQIWMVGGEVLVIMNYIVT